MKILYSFSLLFFLLTIHGCQKDLHDQKEKYKINQTVGLEVERVEPLPSKFVLTVEKSFEELFNLNYDTKKSSFITYKGLDQNVILTGPVIISNDVSKYHVLITEENKIGVTPFIMSMNKFDDGSQQIKFSPDITDGPNYFMKFAVVDGIIPLSTVRYGNYNVIRSCNWGCRFGNCTKSFFDSFTDGSAGNAIVSLGCIYFGPECAVTIGTICAVAATQGEFMEPITKKNPPPNY